MARHVQNPVNFIGIDNADQFKPEELTALAAAARPTSAHAPVRVRVTAGQPLPVFSEPGWAVFRTSLWDNPGIDAAAVIRQLETLPAADQSRLLGDDYRPVG